MRPNEQYFNLGGMKLGYTKVPVPTGNIGPAKGIRWNDICSNSNGDIYAFTDGSTIYKKLNASSSFINTGLGSGYLSGTIISGSLYVVKGIGNIFKQTIAGTGSFVDNGNPGIPLTDSSTSLRSTSSGALYLTTSGPGSGSVRWRAAGGTAGTAWSSFSLLNASYTCEVGSDVYACCAAGFIYKQTGGTGSFSVTEAIVRNWNSIVSSRYGDVYAFLNTGGIYKRTSGTGSFATFSTTSKYWTGACLSPDNVIYCSDYFTDIYKLI